MAAHLAEILYRKMLADIDQRLILTDERRLMTEPMLSRHYGVAVGTIRKAVSRLVEENVLERIQGCGTFLKTSGGEVPFSVPALRYSAVCSNFIARQKLMIAFWILPYPVAIIVFPALPGKA